MHLRHHARLLLTVLALLLLPVAPAGAAGGYQQVVDLTFPVGGATTYVAGDDGGDCAYVHLGRNNGPATKAYAPGIAKGTRVRSFRSATSRATHTRRPSSSSPMPGSWKAAATGSSARTTRSTGS